MDNALIIFNSKVQAWREKARRGELTQDEMREAIQLLRAIREAVPETTSRGSSGSGSGKAKKPKPDGDALLSDLGI